MKLCFKLSSPSKKVNLGSFLFFPGEGVVMWPWAGTWWKEISLPCVRITLVIISLSDVMFIEVGKSVLISWLWRNSLQFKACWFSSFEKLTSVKTVHVNIVYGKLVFTFNCEPRVNSVRWTSWLNCYQFYGYLSCCELLVESQFWRETNHVEEAEWWGERNPTGWNAELLSDDWPQIKT